jgi:phage-related minor tail protein
MDDQVTLKIGADTTSFERSLRDLQLDADRFASVLTQGLKSAVISGNSLEDVLKSVGRQLASNALSIGLKPFENLLGGVIGSLFAGITPFANGGIPGIASGLGTGIVSTPTVFGAGGRLGLMGEAGAEAIMPLSRDANGRLGVAGGSGAAPVNVSVTISTPDANSFRRSEGQVAAMLARAVSRGSRNL